MSVSSDTQISILYKNKKTDLLNLFQRHLKHHVDNIDFKKEFENLFHNPKGRDSETLFSNDNNPTDEDCYNYFHSLLSNKDIEEVKDESIDYRSIYRVKDLEGFYDFDKCDTNTMYLDVGGGNGKISSAIGKRLGIDKNNIFCADIKDWFDSDRVVSDDVTNIEIDGQNLPFENGTFDLITCFQSLHHMEHLNVMLFEISRVLKKGGTLIIREHDCPSSNKYLTMLVDVEHCIFELVLKKYNKQFVDTYFANYKSSHFWNQALHGKNLMYVNANYPTKSKFNNPTKFFYAMYLKVNLHLNQNLRSALNQGH